MFTINNEDKISLESIISLITKIVIDENSFVNIHFSDSIELNLVYDFAQKARVRVISNEKALIARRPIFIVAIPRNGIIKIAFTTHYPLTRTQSHQIKIGDKICFVFGSCREQIGEPIMIREDFEKMLIES